MTTDRIGRRLLVALAALLIGSSILVGTAEPSTASPSAEHELVERINGARCAAGLAPLTLHAGLSSDARAWSQTMMSTGRFAHAPGFWGDIRRALPDARWGAENIGRGPSAASLHDAFMGSPGHRANNLSQATAVGVGIVTSPHGQLWVTVRFATSPSVRHPGGGSSFNDVVDGAFYADAVSWMRRTDLTTGVGGTSCFQPDSTVTRGELATFVHRLAGSPTPARRSPFPDVPTDAYYQRAVDWMYSQGLTTGVGGTGLYRPDDPVDRGQLATVLHRLAGSPGLGAHRFVDVHPGHFADGGVAWMAHHRITTGVGGSNTFQPHQPVTRGQLATFLHRMVSTPASTTGAPIPLAVGA